MGDIMKKIEFLGLLMCNTGVTHFEPIEILTQRTLLQKEYDKMNFQEKLKLAEADLLLLYNLENIKTSIEKQYDFSTSKITEEHWWWHLSKVASEEIKIKGLTMDR